MLRLGGFAWRRGRHLVPAHGRDFGLTIRPQELRLRLSQRAESLPFYFRVVGHPSVTRFRVMSGLAVIQPQPHFLGKLSERPLKFPVLSGIQALPLRCRVFVISREALKRVSHRGSTEGTCDSASLNSRLSFCVLCWSAESRVPI
jgi:hypothetical protein